MSDTSKLVSRANKYISNFRSTICLFFGIPFKMLVYNIYKKNMPTKWETYHPGSMKFVKVDEELEDDCQSMF